MQCVILAAGKGTRLLPITSKRPKAMLPILGKPIIERVMESLRNDVIDEFILVVNPKDHEIIDYFQHKSSFDTKVRFAYQVEPLGTANALNCAAPLIRGDFVLSACDNLMPDGDIQHMFDAWREKTRPTAILALMRVSREMTNRSGMVKIEDGWVQSIIEKPEPEEAPSDIASLPLYYLPYAILDFLNNVKRSPRGEYELQDVIQMLIENMGFVRGILVSSRLTLTEPVDLLHINRHYLSANSSQVINMSKSIGVNTRLKPPLYIEAGSIIGKNCLIGPNVYIEHECYIRDGSVIQDSILLRGASIQPGVNIRSEVVY